MRQARLAHGKTAKRSELWARPSCRCNPGNVRRDGVVMRIELSLPDRGVGFGWVPHGPVIVGYGDYREQNQQQGAERKELGQSIGIAAGTSPPPRGEQAGSEQGPYEIEGKFHRYELDTNGSCKVGLANPEQPNAGPTDADVPAK